MTEFFWGVREMNTGCCSLEQTERIVAECLLVTFKPRLDSKTEVHAVGESCSFYKKCSLEMVLLFNSII